MAASLGIGTGIPTRARPLEATASPGSARATARTTRRASRMDPSYPSGKGKRRGSPEKPKKTSFPGRSIQRSFNRGPPPRLWRWRGRTPSRRFAPSVSQTLRRGPRTSCCASPSRNFRRKSSGASTTLAALGWWRRAAAPRTSAASATTRRRTTLSTASRRRRWCACAAASVSLRRRRAAGAASRLPSTSARCATSGTTPRMRTTARSATCAGGAKGWGRTSSTACSATRASRSPWGRTTAGAAAKAATTARAASPPWRAIARCARTSCGTRTRPSRRCPAGT
mmetsp:Transcript_10299/g.43836  ORF Transcript_10299/g.43836 Transcript_10299/m.43836 type:complete len:283 (+) Transcript_10299:1697-2545(+)